MPSTIIDMNAKEWRSHTDGLVKQARALRPGDPERLRLIELAQGGHQLASYLEAEQESEVAEAEADQAQAAGVNLTPEEPELSIEELIQQGIEVLQGLDAEAAQHLLRDRAGDILGILDRKKGTLKRIVKDRSGQITGVTEEPYEFD